MYVCFHSGKTMGNSAKLMESLQRNGEFRAMVNWWLVGFLLITTFAGLNVLFGWWWLLIFPVAIIWDRLT